MKPNPIKDKSIDFAILTYEFCKFVDNKHLYEISKQLKKSGTSIGAQIFESEHAESKADFIHKLSISQKEANETLYWIEIIYKLKAVDLEILENYKANALELKKRLTSIIKKLKNIP